MSQLAKYVTNERLAEIFREAWDGEMARAVSRDGKIRRSAETQLRYLRAEAERYPFLDAALPGNIG